MPSNGSCCIHFHPERRTLMCNYSRDFPLQLMENLLALCVLSWLIQVIDADAKHLGLKEVADGVPKGKACITPEGRRGLQLDSATCLNLISGNSFIPGCCYGESNAEKTIACCSVFPVTETTKSSHNQQKRAAPPPPDTPNLRVKGCGVRRSLRDFVVGGREADSWPWMASIFVRAEGARTSRFVCGGVVLNRRYILTAAHCFGQSGRTVPAASVTVRVGSPTISGGTTFPVSDVIVHENYRNNLHYHDIALLRTSTDIEVKNVVPVCLPLPGRYNANFLQRPATVLGWGDVSYGGKASDVLMEATFPVIPNKRCDRRYRRLAPLSLPQGIIDTQLCAGSQDGSRDACQGDSGGPLLFQGAAGKWNVVGIVSFGYRCGEPEYPGVYTRVAKYLTWIQDHTDIVARGAT